MIFMYIRGQIIFHVHELMNSVFLEAMKRVSKCPHKTQNSPYKDSISHFLGLLSPGSLTVFDTFSWYILNTANHESSSKITHSF